MKLSTVAPNSCSNLRQYGHKESSYIDSTTVGWPVPGSVITLLDVTRIALASTALALGSGASIKTEVTAIVNTTAATTIRVSWRRHLALGTQPSLSPGRNREAWRGLTATRNPATPRVAPRTVAKP